MTAHSCDPVHIHFWVNSYLETGLAANTNTGGPSMSSTEVLTVLQHLLDHAWRCVAELKKPESNVRNPHSPRRPTTSSRGCEAGR